MFGGPQLAATYEWQPGPLIDFGNLFYYGKLEDILAGPRSLERWFNIDHFERSPAKGPANYHRRVFPTRTEGLRRDMTNQWNVNLQREFSLPKERGAKLFLRFDMLNLQNRSQFNAPDSSPYSTNFGRVTSQSAAVNRFIQIQGRIQF